jgi:hypothetical protein
MAAYYVKNKTCVRRRFDFFASELQHIDGDFYERRKSVLPNFSGEAKNLTSLRKI